MSIDGAIAGLFILLQPVTDGDDGKKISNEIFSTQKKRIYNALLNSSSEEVINFDNVLSKIIHG